MDNYTMPVLEPVFRTTAVEHGSNHGEKKKKDEKEFKTKMQKKLEEETEVRVKAYPSYDAFARKITVYPFRSSGFEV